VTIPTTLFVGAVACKVVNDPLIGSFAILLSPNGGPPGDRTNPSCVVRRCGEFELALVSHRS